jgi:uncharacterized membrane protein YhiD involved in acid resistance
MWKRILNYPSRLQAVVVSLVSCITAFGVAWDAEMVAGLTTLSAALISLFLEKPGKTV